MVGGLGGELTVDMEDEVAENKDEVEAGKCGQQPVEDLLPQLPTTQYHQSTGEKRIVLLGDDAPDK